MPSQPPTAPLKADTSKRELIYAAAAQLFREKGYAATSVRDLAKAVDLKASSLYNHIRSKEEILRAICFRNAERFLQEMEQVEQGGGGPAGQVRTLLSLHIRMATEDVTSITAFNDEWRHLSEPDLSAFKHLRRDYEQRFCRILKGGIQQGVFRPGDAKVYFYTLLAAVRWIYDRPHTTKELSNEALEHMVRQLLLEGLHAK